MVTSHKQGVEIEMDTLIGLSWRAYPGAALLASGVVLMLRGDRILLQSFRMSARDRERPIAFVSGLRMALIGMAIAGLAGAWIWQQLWLLALSLAIGGEELLETSFVLFVLRKGQKQDAKALTGKVA